MKLIKTVRKVKKVDAVSTPESRDAKLKKVRQLVTEANDLISDVTDEMLSFGGDKTDKEIKKKNWYSLQNANSQVLNLVSNIKQLSEIILR